MRSAADGISLDIAPTIPDVFLVALGLAFAAFVLWLSYRSMQRPRLPVIKEPGKPPRVSWTGVLKYALTIPFMILFWMFVLLTLLASTALERDANQVALATVAIVGAARLLAHINHELAHEVAKNVPIVILGLVLVGGSFAGEERFTEVFDGLSEDVFDTFLLGLVLFDYIVTGVWFAVQRRHWHRRQERLGAGKPLRGAIRQAWDSWRRIGTTP